MAQVIYTKKLKAKIWIKDKVEKTKKAVAGVGKWAIEHPTEAFMIGSGVSAGVWKGHRILEDHREEIARQRKFYDTRRGYSVYAKRKVTPSERDEIDRRFAAGETYNHILQDMNLLKH